MKPSFRLNFPEELPICAFRDEIEGALRKHNVVIVCGDTGSGKTTQLPKMALEVLQSSGQRIACTQPRRLAAVSMAERVADELDTNIGDIVGFQHRYDRKLSRETQILFLTDGVLLAKTSRDPLLREFSTIIIDEAHERSLNIDFLLGILKRILQKRRDLKVIVSSATLDSNLFSRFFDGAPIINVPGRLFPIETRYQEPPEDEEYDLPHEISRAIHSLPTNGDVLVFLPGERDIREAAETLTDDFRSSEIIPLIASLPASEQKRAFRTSSHRRIVLATNVAETSVTIPGIRYVVDSGLARISRFIHRTQVQRLQIEKISQASARQRQGRSGRLAPGICIRLYSEEDFLRRDEYTSPEILRTSLAGVILTMLDLRLGAIEDFPFINKPDQSMIKEGLRELQELGAITDTTPPMLTHIGKDLARIPVEPRYGKMLLCANREAVLPSVLPIVAAMACEDPRRRTIDEKQKADEAHAKFKVQGSDFLGTLKLWQWWQTQTFGASQNQARKLCRQNYLSYPKMREWRDLISQLEHLALRMNLNTSQDTGDTDAIARSLLSGLLGRIGIYDAEKRNYFGARGIRFSIFPGSILFKHPPKWVMAGELVDTSRLYAREAATIDPKWLERIASHIMRHVYKFPEWDPVNGFVRAQEDLILYGLTIVQGRRCDYSRIDPQLSRTIFIRQGLIAGAFPKPPPIVQANIRLTTELREEAEKKRQPELFQEDALASYLDEAIPKEIVSAPALCKWLAQATPTELSQFRLKREDWINQDTSTQTDFPNKIRLGDKTFTLTYRNTLGDDDGITCTLPKQNAHLALSWRSDWLVPGALPEKLNWMLSCLPSAQRRILSPINETISRLLTYLTPGQEPLEEALARTIQEHWGLPVYKDAWANIRMPTHFLVRFVIIDDKTKQPIATSRSLQEALKCAGITTTPTSPTQTQKQKTKYNTWEFPDLPSEITVGKAGWEIKEFVALRDEKDGVTKVTFTDPNIAERTHEDGIARLILLSLGKRNLPSLRPSRLPIGAQLYLKSIPYDEATLNDDLALCAIKAAFINDLPIIRTKAEFENRLTERATTLGEITTKLEELAKRIFSSAPERLYEASKTWPQTQASIKNQIAWLFYPGFLRSTPFSILTQYMRYLDAIRIRIEKAILSPPRDAEREAPIIPYWLRYRDFVTAKKKPTYSRTALQAYRWAIEEYRISIFAQTIRTAYPISPKRLDALWEKISPTKVK